MELRFFNRSPATTTNNVVMHATGLCNGIEAWKAIQDNCAATAKALLAPSRNLNAPDALDYGELITSGPSFYHRFNGSHKGNFTLDSTSRLVSTTLITEIAVNQPDKIGQCVPFSNLIPRA